MYVFFGMIYRKYINLKPNYIIFISDYSKENFRNKIYKNYKANRKLIDDNLNTYIICVKKFFKKLNLNIITLKNFEADDLISSYISKIKNFFKKNYTIYILSNDKDFTQLVNKNVFLIIKKDNILDIKEVQKKYGVLPYLIKDLLTLKGDKSDNIPGIKGIGSKNIINILNNIGNIKKIYKNLNKIKTLKLKNCKKIINLFKKNKVKIYLNNKLINLKNNLNFKFQIRKHKISTSYFKKIYLYLKYFEFNKNF